MVIALVLLVASNTPTVVTRATTDEVPTACPITRPPIHPFVQPVSRSEWLHPGEFWFGTRKLWTVLRVDGIWKGLPHYTPDDPTFRQKLFWWRHGDNPRDEPQPTLTVTGRRLDGPAPPLLVDPISNYWPQPDQTFKVVGINIPTLGCWQLTGQYGDARVTYVVWVTE